MGLTHFPNGISSFGVPVLGGSNKPYTGNTYFVDGNDTKASDNNPGTFSRPFLTIDGAVGKCTANNGDYIFVKEGHVETVSAAGGLDLDVAGITIVFLGEGADRAYINFTSATTADMDIDAASITLINPKFVAGVDQLAGPIDVNAADFKMVNAEYHDATDIETTDCIIADSNAARMIIDGWRFVSVTETNAQKQSNIQLNGADNVILKNIDIRGNFAVGCLENVTDEVLNIRIEDCYFENLCTTPKPAMFIDADATGSCKNVKCKIYSGATYVSNVGKLSWDNDCEGFMGDGVAGDPIGTALAAVGTVFTVSKTMTSSAITYGSAVDLTGVSTGTLLVEDVILKTDGSTGLASGTNLEIKSNNAAGLANILVETVANLGAAKTIDLAGASITGIKTILEEGKKLQIQSTVADCTGAGTVEVTFVLRRLSVGATVSAA